MLVQQTLYKLSHLPGSLSCGMAVRCKLPRRTQQSQSLKYSYSSPRFFLFQSSWSAKRGFPHFTFYQVSHSAFLEQCLQEPSNPGQIVLLIPKNDRPHQVSDSQFNPSLCAGSLWMIREYRRPRPSHPHLRLRRKEWQLEAVYCVQAPPPTLTSRSLKQGLIMPKECFWIVLLLLPKNRGAFTWFWFKT